jgi:cellulose biosynthesis protein BcsQ
MRSGREPDTGLKYSINTCLHLRAHAVTCCAVAEGEPVKLSLWYVPGTEEQITAANYVISPIELEAYSTDGIASMLKTLYGIRQKLNPGLQFLGMLPSRVNPHSPAQKANLIDLLKNHSDLVVRKVITQRTSTGESATAKKPVWAIRKTSARDAGREMKAVLAHIFEKMGGLPHGA